MKILRTAIAGILALVTATAALAQTFPSVPDRSVIGRIGTGSGSGPSQAIPFATLAATLNAVTGPGSSVAGNLPYWTSTTGTALGAAAWANIDTTNKRLVIRKESTNAFPVQGTTAGFDVFGPDSPGGEGRLNIMANTSDAVLFCGRVNGTWAAPTVVTAGQQICGWTGGSIDTNGSTTIQQGGAIGGYALNTWSPSDHSWYWDVWTIPSGSTTTSITSRFTAAGGFSVGASSSTRATALGTINADVGYTVAGAAATSGNVLRGDGTKFVGAQLSPADLSVGAGAFTTITNSGTQTSTVQNASALAVGRQGATSPAFQVDSSTASGVTGLKVTSQIATGGANLAVISSGTNENLFVDAKGSGTINIGLAASTGAINLGRATTIGQSGSVAGQLNMVNATSGSIAINPPAGALGSAVWTLQTGTDTFVGKATTDTLTNKTIDTASASNTFKINGTTVATAPNFQQALSVGLLSFKVASVNFNSANSDNAVAITLPTGFTRYMVYAVILSHASQTLTTATMGVFTSTGGGGTTVVSNSAITVSTASESTANNAQSFNTSFTTTYTAGTLQVRVGTAQGAAATGDVTILVFPVS